MMLLQIMNICIMAYAFFGIVKDKKLNLWINFA